MKQEDDRDPLIVLFCYVSDVPGHCGRRDLKINNYTKTYLKATKKKTEIKIRRQCRETREGRMFSCLFCFKTFLPYLSVFDEKEEQFHVYGFTFI